jgi:hypothetical protein
MDFLLVGAQKCATSWLYYCLRDHPEIHLPSKKREGIYLGGDLHRKHGTDWYFQHVGEPKDGQRAGDVSVDYLFDPRSPAAVEDELGDLKVVASLRSPLDRAVSSYFWNLRRGHVREHNLNEGLLRAAKEWKSMQPETTYDPEEYCFNMIARGTYARQLERYLDQSGPESLYLLYYEDIRERPLDTLQHLYQALGVDASFRPSSLTRRPKQNSYLRPLLRLEQATPNTAFWGKATDIAHQVAFSIGLGQERPSLSDEVEDQLRSLYEPSDDRLKDLVRYLPRSNVLTPGDPLPPWTTESS